MSVIRETSSLTMGKGCKMRFMVDESQPKDSIHSHWAETSYDGQPESWVPEIGSHWHKNHDEYMEILEGEIEFVLDGNAVLLKAGDSPLHIPKLHVHSFKFIKGIKTTFTEKTDPVGDFKEAFFKGVMGTADGKPNLLSVMRSFYEGDCFISLPGGFKAVDENFTWSLHLIAKYLLPKSLTG